jgi:hypothetical protein
MTSAMPFAIAHGHLTARGDEITSSEWEMVNAELGNRLRNLGERSEGEKMLNDKIPSARCQLLAACSAVPRYSLPW